MALTGADYVVLAVTLGGAVIGLFIGFSGALAFLCGTAAAAAAGTFAFPMLASEIANVWVRGAAVGLGGLIVFGLVRLIVKKLVHGLVAQPGDAIFGSLTAAVSSFAVASSVVWLLGTLTGESAFASSLLQKVLACVGR